MKRRFTVAMLSVLAIIVSAGCRGAGERARRRPTPESIVEPTPDTTPVESLRTPAGLALKPEPTGTPEPARSPAAPAAGPATTPTAGAKS